MILKCIVAYARWVWGISPAFYQIQSPIGELDGFLIWFGVLIDVTAVVGIVCFLASIWLTRRSE